jgi:hypothetical protein
VSDLTLIIGAILTGVAALVALIGGAYWRGGADASQDAKARATRHALDAEQGRERIEDAIDQDSDLARRAHDVGLVRPDQPDR